MAYATYQSLLARLGSKSKSSAACGGPVHPGCMAEKEPACEHILVPLIAQAPIPQGPLQEIGRWLGSTGKRSVLPALAPGLTHSHVFAAGPSQISRLQLVPWGGSAARLASLVLQRALYGERPGLFVSYRRQDAAVSADQIFDEMSHRGFGVFLDRFSGTSGRLFPQEIAEELADRDVVLVLETPGILQSRWTLWEIAFARTYRLGLLALHWPNAPTLRGIADRHQVAPGKNGKLTAAELGVVAAFIERGHTLAALTRRAFYEALVEAAASSKKGAVRPAGEGVVELVNNKKLSKGFVMPSGRPGCLADIHRLVSASRGSSGPPRLLAGQHEHHRPSAQDDLNWLATTAGIRLSGRAEIYKQVRALL
jgi:TIR domain-containing protein